MYYRGSDDNNNYHHNINSGRLPGSISSPTVRDRNFNGDFNGDVHGNFNGDFNGDRGHHLVSMQDNEQNLGRQYQIYTQADDDHVKQPLNLTKAVNNYEVEDRAVTFNPNLPDDVVSMRQNPNHQLYDNSVGPMGKYVDSGKFIYQTPQGVYKHDDADDYTTQERNTSPHPNNTSIKYHEHYLHTNYAGDADDIFVSPDSSIYGEVHVLGNMISDALNNTNPWNE